MQSSFSEFFVESVREASPAEVFKSFFESANHHQLAIAAWRLPFQQQKHVIIDLSGEAKPIKSELEVLPAGFIFSPFLSGSDALSDSYQHQSIYLHADVSFSTDAHKITVNPVVQKAKVDYEEIVVDIERRIRGKKKQPIIKPFFFPEFKEEMISTSKSEYVHLVEKAVEAIYAGVFQKVVPSKQKVIAIQKDLGIVHSFFQLCEAYPHAFISLVSIPGVGTWLGASPEMLIQTFREPFQQHRIFRTVALAGTQPLKKKNSLYNAAWRQKEIEEQAMVCRYVINCFKKIRLREYEEEGPKTVAAGNLMHLKTEYTVDMDVLNFPELATIMLELLHPTSAVCGMPREATLSFLQEHENMNRSFYSGFLGPVNIGDEINIYVNLRCMQLFREKAILYAGAGVTADSVAEKEWLETEMKTGTLLHILK